MNKTFPDKVIVKLEPEDMKGLFHKPVDCPLARYLRRTFDIHPVVTIRTASLFGRTPDAAYFMVTGLPTNVKAIYMIPVEWNYSKHLELIENLSQLDTFSFELTLLKP